MIHVSMLGECSIEYRGSCVDSSILRSKKIWSLLQFLIFHRNEEINRDELLSLVYAAGGSTNPQNALKTLMHRCRSVLEQLGYADSKLMIIQHGGSYKWNSALPLTLDAERFDSLYSSFSSAEENSDEAYKLCREALTLYHGDFLAKYSAPWIVPLRERYRTQYLSLVQSAIDMMYMREDYDELVLLCRSALSSNRYDESLYLSLMSALIKQGKPHIAMSVYEQATKLFYRELGVTPSEELSSIYREIVRSMQNVELDINIIKTKLSEDSQSSGAFFCEYEFFKDIYRLEVRSSARTGSQNNLCLLTLVSSSEKPLGTKTLSHMMDRLIALVEENLRRGDVFARYSVCQLIVLLPLTSPDNATLIAERISRAFAAVNTHVGTNLTYSVKAIDAAI